MWKRGGVGWLLLAVFLALLVVTLCPRPGRGQTAAPVVTASGYFDLTWTIPNEDVSDTTCQAVVLHKPSRDKLIYCYLWKKRNNKDWKYATLTPIVGPPGKVVTKSVYVYNGLWKFKVVPYDDDGNRGPSCHYFVGIVTAWGGNRFQYPALDGTMGSCPLRMLP